MFFKWFHASSYCIRFLLKIKIHQVFVKQSICPNSVIWSKTIFISISLQWICLSLCWKFSIYFLQFGHNSKTSTLCSWTEIVSLLYIKKYTTIRCLLSIQKVQSSLDTIIEFKIYISYSYIVKSQYPSTVTCRIWLCLKLTFSFIQEHKE